MQKILLPTNYLLFVKFLTTSGKEYILKGFIEDMTGKIFKEVKPLNPYHIDNFKNIKKDGTFLRNTEVDVLAVSIDGEHITIEMQMYPHEFFMERSLLYVCEAYRKNYANRELEIIKDNKYSSLKNTYGINILNFDLFNPEHSCVNKFSLINEEYGYKIDEIKNMNTIRLIYFSFTNPNTGENGNYKNWQDFFKGNKLSVNAPEYIKDAKKIVDFHNLTEEERTMAETLTKQEAIRMAEITTARMEGIVDTALRLLDMGSEVQFVSRATGLSIDKVRELKDSIKN